MPVKLVAEQVSESLGNDIPLADLIAEYAVAKERLERIERYVEGLNKEIKRRMEEAHQKTKTIPWGSKKLRATYSSNTNIVIDEQGLKKALGARAFHKVTIEKVDRTKLNEAVAANLIDGNIVRQYVRNEPRPQLRLSFVEESDDET